MKQVGKTTAMELRHYDEEGRRSGGVMGGWQALATTRKYRLSIHAMAEGLHGELLFFTFQVGRQSSAGDRTAVNRIDLQLGK